MGTTWNPDILVNLYGSAQSVKKTSFGLIAVCSAGASYSGKLYEVYEDNTSAQADGDLDSGTKAAVAAFFSQVNHPTKVLVGKVTYESAGGELTTSLDALLAAVNGSEDEPYAYCVMSRAKADQVALAAWATSNSKLAWVQSSDSDILSGTAGNAFETINGTSTSRAAMLYHATDTEYGDVAWSALVHAVDLDQQSTVAYDKTLTGVAVDDITASEKTTVTGYNGNLYLTLKGVGATGEGKVANGDWIDEVMIKDWLVERIEEAIAQLRLDMSARGQKIAYTNAGLGMIESAIRSVTRKGERVGHFAEGETVINTPDISDVSSADITARKATIPVTVTLAGAIKEITINVGVLDG